jgi:hypothetical protein
MWDPEEHAGCGTLEFPDTEPNGQAMLRVAASPAPGCSAVTTGTSVAPTRAWAGRMTRSPCVFVPPASPEVAPWPSTSRRCSPC